MASGSNGGGGSGGGGFVRNVGSRGVQYVQASQGRQTAVLLIVAILLARLLLTKQLQAFWGTLWGPTKPLGQALPTKAAAQGQTSTGKSSNSSSPSGGAGADSQPPIFTT